MKITSDILKAAALEYLRYEAGCRLVCVERSPLIRDPCIPDVVGVTDKRRMIEVEIKISWSDFKRGREKSSLFRRRFYGIKPWKYYFLIPPEMVEKVKPVLEEGEGLMTVSTGSSLYSGVPKICVVKPALSDKNAQVLKLREIVKMVAHQTGSLVSAMAKVAKLKNPEAVPDEMASI